MNVYNGQPTWGVSGDRFAGDVAPKSDKSEVAALRAALMAVTIKRRLAREVPERSLATPPRR